MSNLKKLEQSVFDGLPSEYKFAAVDANGFAWAYEEQPDMISFDGMRRFISRSFDATDWQYSLIERKEITEDALRQTTPEEVTAAKKSLRRGDLVEYDGNICVVYKKLGDVDGIGYRVALLTGNAGQWYVPHENLTRIGSIRKKIRRLKAQMEGAK